MKKEVGTFNTDLVPSFLCVHVCVCVCVYVFSALFIQTLYSLGRESQGAGGGTETRCRRLFFFNSSTQFGPEQV